MAYQSIGLGATANDGSGDTLRDGATKVNANFVEIYTALGDGSSLTSGISADANDVTFTGANYNAVWDKSDSALEFADNAKAKFGTGGDLEIYHSGSHSYIAEAGDGTGNLFILGTNITIGDQGNSHTYFSGTSGGASTLYHDNNQKLATTSTGISVTGDVTTSGKLIASGNVELSAGITLIFEGASADAYETTLTVVDPTADRTISLPNVTGTVITTGDSGTITAGMLASDIEITGNQLKSSSTLLIVNSSGSTLKTVIGAGSAS